MKPAQLLPLLHFTLRGTVCVSITTGSEYPQHHRWVSPQRQPPTLKMSPVLIFNEGDASSLLLTVTATMLKAGDVTTEQAVLSV